MGRYSHLGLFAGAVATAIQVMVASGRQSKELTTLQQQEKDGEMLLSQQRSIARKVPYPDISTSRA